MRNLIIMRHAKSDWGNSSLSDIDRPLNERGLMTAPFIGKELLSRNKVPDLIISSPANRAKTTAQLAAKSFNYAGEIFIDHTFYFGSLEAIVEKIKKTDNSVTTLMIVGHNPTWETLVDILSESSSFIQMPTAAIASIIFKIDSWNNLKPNTGSLEFLLIPKELKA